MAGLIGLLDMGAGAFSAQQSGIAVAGRNVANVTTEGYSRERVDLSSLPGVPIVGGVRSGDPHRLASGLIASRERSASGAEGRMANLSMALLDLESRVTGSDNVAARIGDFFASWSQLSASPTDEVVRADVVGTAREIARSFQAGAAAISGSRSDADARITSLAQEASALASQIARANEKLQVSADPVLADQRDEAAKQLSALTGGEARIDPDGHMRFVVGGGVVLVDGDRASKLVTAPDSNYDGFVRLDVVDGTHVQDVTQMVDGGRIGGELTFRDRDGAQAAQRLDQLAFDFASSVNTVHSSNAALDGSSGHDLFVAPGQVDGAAAAMAVDATVDSDPTMLAAADLGAPQGDNVGALELLDLRDQLLAGGGTRSFGDESVNLLSSIGSAAAAAQDLHGLELQRLDLANGLRDGLSGVSIEEEMTKLAQFRTAAEAATRFISTVDEVLQDLLRM
jgi:flagellar hook-associated protein 1 FlgK